MKKKSSKRITQSSIILDFFLNNQKRDIAHPEIVDWAIKKYSHKTKKVLRDPDRAIRKFHQQGYLVKVSNGVYRYDPDLIKKRELEDFSPEMKKAVLKKGKYKCAVCGKGKKEGVTLHVDHIKPKDLGGKATLENGQVLCEFV